MPTTPRKDPLEAGEVYHVMNKSIAGFKIFNTDKDYLRMIYMLRYFQANILLPKFSRFLQLKEIKEKGFEAVFKDFTESSSQHIQIISYCLMPTHIHLVVRQLTKKGISIFMANLLNSYARYFNTKYKRKGPLWVGRFKNVLVKKDEQLLHLTRYVHLNPSTAELVKKPEDWPHSSYTEYKEPKMAQYPLCQYDDLIDMKPKAYKSFVNNHIDYQRELGKIKKLVLE